MDLLRLPSALRRSIFQSPHAFRRLLSTAPTNNAAPNPTLSSDTPTSSPPPLLKLTPTTLNTYTATNPPFPLALHQANAFFHRHDPTLLYTSARFLDLPPSPYPEVAVLGRSNVGKSSLLNALFGRPRLNLAHVSKKPGKTRTINGYGVGGDSKKKGGGSKAGPTPWKSFGRGGIIVVDMPGYGKGSREDWGKEIMKYLENRKQLRRTYVLVDAEHGLKSTDLSLLVHLRRQGIAYQIVLSKADKILFPRPKAPSAEKLSEALGRLGKVKAKVEEGLNEAAAEAGIRSDVVEDILCCSGNPDKVMEGAGRKRMIGVDELRWNMLTACGMEGSKKLELGGKMKKKLQAEQEDRGSNAAWMLYDDDSEDDWDGWDE